MPPANHGDDSLRAGRIGGRVRRVRARIAEACARTGRDPSEVTLVAVAKGRSAPEVRAAIAAGVADIGESYAQDAEPKVAEVGLDTCRWHFVGHLQRNKVRQVLQYAAWVHSIDSVALAREVSSRAHALGKCVQCLVEVNVAGETAKHGVDTASAPALCAEASELEHIELVGLMTVAPWTSNPEEVRWVFAALRELSEQCRERGLPMTHLSMGMTGDFEIGVEEGATLVRIGTAIFGPRDV
jgi:hypothetical protein